MFEAKIKIEVERLDEILGAAHAIATALAFRNVAPVSAEAAMTVQAEEPKAKRKAAKKAAPAVEEPAEAEVAPAATTMGKLESKPADPVEADAPVTVGKLESKPADPVEADTPVTLGELQGLCIDVAKKKGKETVMVILQSMGASGLSKVPENRYAAVRDALRGAL